MTTIAAFWQSLAWPGHEAARLTHHGYGHRLEGVAVGRHEGRVFFFEYAVECSLAWETMLATVRGWIHDEPFEATLTNDDGRWAVDNVEAVDLAGCVDIDFGFSPSTNTLPINRLGLDVGESASVSAVWLRFPGLTFERLEQSYIRLAERTYRYTSGDFTRELVVDDSGMVMDYPGAWKAEA